jgi:xanthine/uracil permease
MTLLCSLSLLAGTLAALLLMLGRTDAARWLGIRAVLIPLIAAVLFRLVPCLLAGVPESAGSDIAILCGGGILSGIGYVLWQRRGLPKERLLPRERVLPPAPRFDAEER